MGEAMRAVDGGDDEGIVELLRRGVTVCAKVLLMRRVTAESEASASPHLTVARGRSETPQREHCGMRLSDCRKVE